LAKKRIAKAASRQSAVLETSVLVNFLRVDRVDLLAQHPDYRFTITDHVRAEITDDYPDQLERLEKALSAKVFDLASVDALDPHFVALSREGRYGAGECAAIALAVGRNIPIAIDDNRARKAARKISDPVTLESTETLMIGLIKSGTLDVESADAIKAEWEANHRFTFKFKSFAEKA
jgi:predicted nucleic acid-binding protein